MVVVEKKEVGAKRMCVDMRRFNAVTIGDSYPAQGRIADVENAKVFSILDLASGFYQIPMKPEDRDKTAFITKNEMYRYTRVPFGPKNAPATFQRVMERVLDGLTFAVAYIDDILMYSPDTATHLEHLDIVLTRLRSVNMKVKTKKCHFALQEVKYLGHIVTPEEIKPDSKAIQAIIDLKQPETVTEVRAFLGVVGYYRGSLKDTQASPRH